MTHTRSALLLGYGYVAKATAPRLAKAGFSLTGTTRSAEKAAEMALAGVSPLVNPAADELRAAFEAASHVLLSVPPSETGDPVLAQLHGVATGGLTWLGYLSTTGVYGDAGGGRVDESTPPAPSEPRSQWRLEAEQGWQALTGRARIFRLAGIYGPGRSALDRVREGVARRIIKPGQVFSRIHVADIASTLLASIRQPDVPGPFNLADEAPAPQADVVTEACRLLGVTPPPEEDFETAQMSEMMRSFYSASRRVSGEATRKALGVTLEYPTYREGLAAIYAAST